MTGHEVAVVNLVLRAGSSRWRAPIAVALAVVATFLITAIPIRAGGANPAAAYWRYLVTPLTSWNGVQEVLLAASPLLLTGLAVAIAFRAGYYNIGAEGQFLAGAIGATVPGLYAVRSRCLAGASAGPLGRRRRRAAVGAAAGLAQARRRHRRGGDDAAPQPGGAAVAAGTAQRSVAPPGERVPGLRDVRPRLRAADDPRQRTGSRRAADRGRGDRRDRRRDVADTTRAARSRRPARRRRRPASAASGSPACNGRRRSCRAPSPDSPAPARCSACSTN